MCTLTEKSLTHQFNKALDILPEYAERAKKIQRGMQWQWRQKIECEINFVLLLMYAYIVKFDGFSKEQSLTWYQWPSVPKLHVQNNDQMEAFWPAFAYAVDLCSGTDKDTTWDMNAPWHQWNVSTPKDGYDRQCDFQTRLHFLYTHIEDPKRVVLPGWTPEEKGFENKRALLACQVATCLNEYFDSLSENMSNIPIWKPENDLGTAAQKYMSKIQNLYNFEKKAVLDLFRKYYGKVYENEDAKKEWYLEYWKEMPFTKGTESPSQQEKIVQRRKDWMFGWDKTWLSDDELNDVAKTWQSQDRMFCLR